MHERRLRTGLTGGFQQVERSDGICVEVVKGNCSRAVVARLGGRMDDRRQAEFLDEIEDPLAIANIELVMLKSGQLLK